MNCYEKNIALLRARRSYLVDRLEALGGIKSDRIEPVRVHGKKIITARYNGILLHSMYNPQKEAEEKIRGIDFDNIYFLHIVGFGLGYHVMEILKRVDSKCTVIVTITDIDLFKTAMELVDLEEILASDKLVLLDSEHINYKNIIQDIIFGSQTKIRQSYFYDFMPEKRFNAELFDKLKMDFADMVRYSIKAIGNDPGDTLLGMINIFKNAHYIVNNPDLETKGEIPAVCVSAGPSLNKNIQLLKKVKGKALILCADTVAERLIKEGIEPDIISILERNEEVYDYFFENKEYPSKTALFGESVIDPRIFAEGKGKKVVIFREPITMERVFGEWIESSFLIDPGASVGNMNMSIATMLNCNPIIFIGQDLAFGEDGKTHASGTIHEGKSSKDIAGTDDLVWLDGINGGKVMSRSIWKYFLEWFEKKIAESNNSGTPRIFVNATEGGANINGTRVMKFDDAINKYCKESINFGINDLLVEKSGEKKKTIIDNLLGNVVHEYSKLIELRDIIANTTKMLNDFDDKIIKSKNFKEIEDLNKFIVPINDNMITISQEYKFFSFIVQALFVVMGRENNKIGYINTVEDCENWIRIQRAFLFYISEVLEKTIGIMLSGADILSEEQKNII